MAAVAVAAVAADGGCFEDVAAAADNVDDVAVAVGRQSHFFFVLR